MPASKSKSNSNSNSKDKPSARATKEQAKTSIKPSGATNGGGSSPANAYNPISGTFHTVETSSVASSPPFHDDGRFRNIDDNDEHSSSPHGTVSEYDSVSNNGSCSGDSEDPKEKIANSTPRQEMIPCSDIDRREKIRLKNEKKHQRQKERRAQELHERCSGYLMSRKLEALSQQLVAMGFSSERATLALILNEGKVEESVSWLFEGSEEGAPNKDTDLGSRYNMKIDISEELAQISAMEVRYKCSKQEVERAIVACEGDLEKAEETLRAQKKELPATMSKPEETADTRNLMRPQQKPTVSVTVQQRSEREFNYTKAAAPVPAYLEPGNRNLQSSKMNQLKSLADKRWPATGSSTSVSVSLASPMQVAPQLVKVEARPSGVGNEVKNIRQGAGREPVVVMQRPQSINVKQTPVSSLSASPLGTSGWCPNNVPGVEIMKSNGTLLHKSTGSLNLEKQSSEQFYHQAPYKEFQFMYGPVDSQSAGMGSSWSTMGVSSPALTVPHEPRGSWSTMNASSPSRTVPSSVGLFSGWSSSSGLSSQVDWNTGGLMPECDYTSIDWSLESNPSSSKSSGMWLGISSLLRNSSSMRFGSGNGVCISGLQNGGVATGTTTSANIREWTSPFAGKDIFCVPRQFVTSPSP